MSRWICPLCEREFDRANQSHVCVPGNTVDDCFASRPAVQRAILDALMTGLRELGPVHVDAVKVGVFLKHQRKFAELRPMSRWLSLQVVLPYSDLDPRVDRRIQLAADRLVHVVKLATPADVDGQVNRWLADAYEAAG